MNIETTKMSSKGQIVIPRNIRESLQAQEGTIFAIVHGNNSIVLKKIATPTKEDLIKDLKEIAIKGRKNAEKLGISQKDVTELVHKSRRS